MPAAKLRPILRSAYQDSRNVLVFLWRSFGQHNGFLWATALTYTTLFALVPLLGVALSLFKIFGGFDAVISMHVMPVLSSMLDPTHKIRVMEYIHGYVGRLDASQLGLVGTITFILTFVPLFQNMESAVNRIWEREIKRPFWQRFLIYWTTITLGPLAVALTVSGLGVIGALLPSVGLLDSLKPMLVLYVIFGLFLINRLVPSVRVERRPAFMAALLGGVAWQISSWGYCTYMNRATANFTIYGSLGAIPVFLLWVYINWIIVLAGVEVCRLAQHPEYLGNGSATYPQAQQLEAAVKLLKTLVSDTAKARYSNAKTLRLKLGYPISLYAPLLKTLKQANLVIEKDDILLPAGCEISLYDILSAFIGQISPSELKSLSSEADRLKQITLTELD